MGAEIDSLEIKIETSASAANQQLDRLASKLETISASLGKFNTSSIDKIARSMSGASSATQKATQSTNNLQRFSNAMDVLAGKTNKAGKSLSSFSQIAGNFYANSFLLVRAVKKLWSGVESSMDYVETFNYWNVTLDKIGKEFGNKYEDYGYDSADAYAESFRDRLKELTAKMTGYQIGDAGDLTLTSGKSLGLDPEQMMNYQAKILAVTNSVGLLGETSTNVAKALSMLSADMSSFTNQSLSTVMTNFQSGLIGQSRALYKYGIDITNATLQTYAYENGITKAVSEMTQAEKMQLRLIAILDQSKVAWGDQANTINSVANQYRILKQQISNLARTLGNLFLPIVKSVLPVVNGLIIALNKLFTTLGFKAFGSNWLKDLQDGISSGYDNSGLDEIADSADDTTDSLNDASAAAKKLKGSLRAFDELNVINTNTDSGSSSGADSSTGSIDLSDAIGAALADYESVWDKAFADSENKAQTYADKICSLFNNMWNAIEPFRESVSRLCNKGLNMLTGYSFKNLTDFYNEFLVPIGTWAFGTEGAGLTRLVDVINNGLLKIDWLWISENLREFWKAIEPYAEQFGEGLIDFFEDVSGIAVDVINRLFGQGGAITGITDWLNSNDPERARSWGYSLGEIAIALMAFKGIASILKGIADFGIALKTLHDGLAVIFGSEGVLAKIGTSIVGLVGTISKFGHNIVGVIEIVSGKFGTLGEAISWVFGPAAQIISGIGAIIGGVVLSVKSFFSMWEDGWSVLGEILKDLGIALTAVGAVILGVAATPAAIVAAIVAAVSTIAIVVHDNWDAICEWFSGAADWFDTNVITPIVDFFKGLWEDVSGFFSNLWDDVCDIWSTVSGWFSDTVIEPVVGFFQGLFTRVGQIFEGLWIIVQAIWIVVSDWFNDNIIIPVVSFFQGLWESVSGFFSQLWIDIQTIWSVVSDWFNNTIIVPVVEFFRGLWEDVSGFFSNLWEDIKNVWQRVSGWFNENIITPVSLAFKAACEAIGGFFDRLWSGIKSGVVGAMNAVIGGIESAINFIVGGINNIIGGFNKVVSWAAKVAEVDWGGVELVPTVSIPRIPAYSVGGFPEDGLFYANHSEIVGKFSNGRTAVANNEQITQGIADAVYPAVYNAVSAAMRNNGNGNVPNVNVVLEGEAGGIFKVVRKEWIKESDRLQKNPVPIYNN